MAAKNGYPRHTIYNLKKKLTSRKVQKEKQEQENETTQNKKWITFTYYSPQIRRITNFFKNANIQIAFRTTNTIQQQLNTGNVNLTNPNGIYRLQCMTCSRVYIGQTGRYISTRYKEHIRYVKYNNPQSSYAMHILNNTRIWTANGNTKTAKTLHQRAKDERLGKPVYTRTSYPWILNLRTTGWGI